MENAWIDQLPESGIRGLPRFLIELGTVMKSSDTARQWAQSQWADRNDPRRAARELVPLAEETEEGRRLVAAWRALVETPAPEWPEPVIVLSRAEDLVKDEDPMLAEVLRAARVEVVTQLLLCEGHPRPQLCKLLQGDDLLRSVLDLARATVLYDEQNGGPAERMAEVFDDLGEPELARQVREARFASALERVHSDPAEAARIDDPFQVLQDIVLTGGLTPDEIAADEEPPGPPVSGPLTGYDLYLINSARTDRKA